MAQHIDCSSFQYKSKLVCGFPLSAGVYADATALGPSTSGVAAQSALQTASGVNLAVATQLSQLPLAAASAGNVVVFKNGVYQTFNNLGPILTDRPQTVGKGTWFLGFTASQYVFTSIDGQSLSNLPFTYYRVATAPGGGTVSTTYTQQTSSLRLRVNQFVSVVTYGFNKRADFSLIVPAMRVAFSATTPASPNYVVDASGNPINTFQGVPASASGVISGLGDITGNLKIVISKGERATFSGGLIVRGPTGDKLNLLGAGAYGFTPYLVYSHLSKFSPHARIGFQWNTKSILNPDWTTQTGQLQLPGGLQYDLGADWAVQKHFTLAADILGNQFLNSQVLVQNSATVKTTSGTTTLATNSAQTSSYSVNNVSTGFKWNPVKSFVLSANVLTQINSSGLKARPTPLLGVSYRF